MPMYGAPAVFVSRERHQAVFSHADLLQIVASGGPLVSLSRPAAAAASADAPCLGERRSTYGATWPSFDPSASASHPSA